MKFARATTPLFLLLATAVFVAQPLAVAAPAELATTGRRNDATASPSEDFPALERFLTLSDEQLDRIQQAVAKVRAMSPAERAALHAQMQAFRQLPEAKREQVRAGWGWQNEQDRADWPSMMRSLPPSERAAIQAELQSLPPEHRSARKHALLNKWREAKAER